MRCLLFSVCSDGDLTRYPLGDVQICPAITKSIAIHSALEEYTQAFPIRMILGYVGFCCTRAGQPRKLASPFGRLLRSFWPWQRATASGEIEGQLSHFLLGFLLF
jgi:hypothetical protein